MGGSKKLIQDKKREIPFQISFGANETNMNKLTYLLLITKF